MELVLSFQYYSIFFYSLLMYFLPQVISYSQFALVIAIMASMSIIKYILKYKKIPFLTFLTFAVWMIIVLLYFFGLSNAYVQTELQRTFFLVVLGQTFPAVLLTSLAISKNHEVAVNLNKMIEMFIVLFSSLVFLAVLNPREYTGGGGLSTDFVLNYQNGSYLCAFITNFILFLLISGKEFSKIKKFLLGLLFFLITFSMLAMGGRGGFVSFLVINSILFIYWLNKRRLTVNRMMLYIILGTVAFIGLYLAVINASSVSLGGNTGFNRILSFISLGSDSGRSIIYHKVFTLFLEAPITGYGIGSVFGLLGTHAHNLLLNCLLETGLIGSSILVYVLLNTIRKCVSIIKNDEKNLIGVIVFLQGLCFSMFSGYYLAHVLLYGGIVYIQGKYSMFRSLRSM